MKFINYKSIAILLVTALIFTDCSDFLDEENRSSISIETASSNTETFDQLVASVYERARNYTTCYTAFKGGDMYYVLEDLGTDIATRKSAVSGTNELNDYVNMSSTNWVFHVYWENQYLIIAAANTAIDNAEIIEGVNEDAKNRGVGEAKFFRAWSYFNLVENFGDVPLVLNQVQSAGTNYTRTPEEEVYGQIISDLEDALAAVDEDPEKYGRVSKDAVRHLLSKVLLTRGYKSYGASDDFTQAASLAETIITNYPLVPTFASLIDIDNQRNSEVVFSYLFGSDATLQGWGNSRHMMYKFDYFKYPGMLPTSSTYQRGFNNNASALTPFFYSLFEPGDERADLTIRRVIYAETSSEDGTILPGDTAIYFPETAWSQAKIDAAPYAVVNPGNYFTSDGFTAVHYPMFRKFDEPGVVWAQPDQRSEGTRDMVMMRSGEAYLIAAEAYLKAANKSKAAELLTTLRSRSGLTTAVDENDVDLDFILDERARELAGEVNRWMDLKRTSKLIERTLAHNPHAALNNALTDENYLRPVPQSEIDVTNGSIVQNTGYN